MTSTGEEEEGGHYEVEEEGVEEKRHVYFRVNLKLPREYVVEAVESLANVEYIGKHVSSLTSCRTVCHHYSAPHTNILILYAWMKGGLLAPSFGLIC